MKRAMGILLGVGGALALAGLLRRAQQAKSTPTTGASDSQGGTPNLGLAALAANAAAGVYGTMSEEARRDAAMADRGTGTILDVARFANASRSAYPGWLGRLVQHGTLVQARMAGYLYKNVHCAWDHYYSKGNEGAIHWHKTGGALADAIGWKSRQVWIRKFAEFPAPVRGGTIMSSSRDGRVDTWFWQRWGNDYYLYNDGAPLWKELHNAPHYQYAASEHWDGFGMRESTDLWTGLNHGWTQLSWNKSTRAQREGVRRWLHNARWLVWAAEMWRIHCNEGWTLESTYYSGDRRDLLMRWNQHVLRWGIGFHKPSRLESHSLIPEDPDFKCNLRHSPYPWEIMAELVMSHTPPPGSVPPLNLINSGMLCDWNEGVSGAFAPAINWIPDWRDTLAARHAGREANSWAMKTAWGVGEAVATVAAQEAGAVAATLMSTVVNACTGALTSALARVSDGFATAVQETFSSMLDHVNVLQSQVFDLWGGTVDVRNMPFEDIRRLVDEGKVKPAAELAAIELMDSINKMDKAWGYADALMGGIEGGSATKRRARI